MTIVQPTPAQQIFHRRWNFYIPEIAFLVDEEKKYGHRRTGIDAEDNQRLLASKRRCHITLAKAIDYFHDGHAVVLCDPREGREMVKILLSHLQMWQKALNEQFNLPGLQEDVDKVIDDLVKIDRFLVSLYQMCQRYIPDPIPKSRLDEWLIRKNRGGFIRPNPRLKEAPVDEEATTPSKDEYQSIANDLRVSRYKRREKGWY